MTVVSFVQNFCWMHKCVASVSNYNFPCIFQYSNFQQNHKQWDWSIHRTLKTWRNQREQKPKMWSILMRKIALETRDHPHNIPITRRLAISHKKNSRWMETTDSETPNLETSPKNPYNFPLTPQKKNPTSVLRFWYLTPKAKWEKKGECVGDGLTWFWVYCNQKTKLCNCDEVRALFVHLTTKNYPYPKNRIKT